MEDVVRTVIQDCSVVTLVDENVTLMTKVITCLAKSRVLGPVSEVTLVKTCAMRDVETAKKR